MELSLANAGPDRKKTIPGVGFGCWKLPKETASDLVFKAIEIGYRHIDSACDYGNEKEVGDGIRRALEAGLCSRADLHVTSKLWNTFHAPEHVKMACQRTLDDLGLDYLDLYLIHFPISLKFVPFEKRYPPEWFYDPEAEKPCMEFAPVSMQDTWRAMEALYDQGLAKHIGVANYNCQSLRDLLNYARIKPSVLQVELHPYLQQKRLVRYAQASGVHVTAYSPLGQGASYWRENEGVMYEESVKEIAKKHGRTEAQIILRWGLERGCSIIPKSEKVERIGQNISLFDFALTPDDLEVMAKLEKGMRFNDAGDFCETAFNTFCPIYD